MPKKAPEPTGFAQQLRALREAAGLTQQQLAERAGYYLYSIAKLEQGVQEPTWPTVLALAQALGVEVQAFVVKRDHGEDGSGSEAVSEKRGRGRPRKRRPDGSTLGGASPSKPGRPRKTK
jgi:transcriptional regulator with XRE-family HTH domain